MTEVEKYVIITWRRHSLGSIIKSNRLEEALLGKYDQR
jgi:hypothetical protein